jgi:hypothetical protein
MENERYECNNIFHIVNQHHDDHVGKWKKQRLRFSEEGSHEKASPSSAYVDFVFLDFACQWKSEDVSRGCSYKNFVSRAVDIGILSTSFMVTLFFFVLPLFYCC